MKEFFFCDFLTLTFIPRRDKISALTVELKIRKKHAGKKQRFIANISSRRDMT